MGILRTWQCRFGEAEALLSESFGHAERLRYGAGSVITLLALGQAAHLQGDQTTAKRRYVEACATARDLEDRTSLMLSVIGVAAVATACGNLHEARKYLESDDVASAASTPSTAAEYDRVRARFAYSSREGGAAGLHARVLVRRQRSQDARGILEQLEDIALLCLEAKDRDAAATLLGRATSGRRAMGAPVPPLYRREVESAAVQVRRVSGAWEGGSELPIDEAVHLACKAAQALA